MKTILSLLFVAFTCVAAGGDGCSVRTPESAAQVEQRSQNIQMEQFLRNQPVPSFDWSLERHMLIQLYTARQKATNTFSVVQSEFTGKILWSCFSIGFPLPYATQLTNPSQIVFAHHPSEHDAAGTVSQQEPNGLFSPSTADGTWVPCTDEKGKIVPVYEERKVTTFLRPVDEVDGKLVPKAGVGPSLSIEPTRK